MTSNERAVKTRSIGYFKGSSIHSKVWEFLLCHKVYIRQRFKPCFCTLAYISNKKVDQPPSSFIVSIKKHKNHNTVTCWPWLGLINHFGINKKTDFCSKLLWNASIHPPLKVLFFIFTCICPQIFCLEFNLKVIILQGKGGKDFDELGLKLIRLPESRTRPIVQWTNIFSFSDHAYQNGEKPVSFQNWWGKSL